MSCVVFSCSLGVLSGPIRQQEGRVITYTQEAVRMNQYYSPSPDPPAPEPPGSEYASVRFCHRPAPCEQTAGGGASVGLSLHHFQAEESKLFTETKTCSRLNVLTFIRPVVPCKEGLKNKQTNNFITFAPHLLYCNGAIWPQEGSFQSTASTAKSTLQQRALKQLHACSSEPEFTLLTLELNVSHTIQSSSHSYF